MSLRANQEVQESDDAACKMRARNWLEKNFPPFWRPENLDYKAPLFEEQRDWERRLYEAGFAGFSWPEKYGGQGLTIREHLLCYEEFGRIGVPDSVNGIGKDMIGAIILALGTEEQKTRFLPRILSMEDIWCQGFSEVEAGSDLAGVKTRAVRDSEDWVINGTKIWTSFAQHADWCLVLARTGDPAEKHASLSLFMVPMGARGVAVSQIDQIDGRANFCEVQLVNVRVADAMVLGGISEGWKAVGRVLGVERAINRMYRAAMFENELRHLAVACQSDPHLQILLADPFYRQRLAGCYEDVEILRRLVRSTVLSLLDGGEIGSIGSLIKLHWSETHQRIAGLAREMLAGASRPVSDIVDRAIKRFNILYLRSRAETVQAGASEVQLDVIAGRILHLPKG